MTNFRKKLNKFGWDIRFKAANVVANVKKTLRNEDGDTNFISIAIILVVVLAIAVLFLSLKDKIIPKFTEAINKFEIALG